MIKLTTLIPEIKIQPNNFHQPKVGDIYYFNTTNILNNQHPGEWEVEQFEHGEWLFAKVGYNGNQFWIDLEQFQQYIQQGILKYLRTEISEVKIQPNIKVDTTDKLLFFINRNKKEILDVLRDNFAERYNDNFTEVDWEKGYVKKRDDIITIEDTDGMNSIELSLYRFGDCIGFIKVKGVTIYWAY